MTFTDLGILLPPKNGVPVEYDYYGLARLVFSTGNSGSMVFDAASASGAKLPSLTFSDFVAAYDQTGGTLNVTFSVSFAGKCVLPVSAIYRATM